MPEERMKKIIETMLDKTGPIMPINQFKNYPALPAPQTLRNKLSLGEIPRKFFFKHGRSTYVDMTEFLPYWAEGFKAHLPGQQIGKGADTIDD